MFDHEELNLKTFRENLEPCKKKGQSTGKDIGDMRIRSMKWKMRKRETGIGKRTTSNGKTETENRKRGTGNGTRNGEIELA